MNQIKLEHYGLLIGGKTKLILGHAGEIDYDTSPLVSYDVIGLRLTNDCQTMSYYITAFDANVGKGQTGNTSSRIDGQVSSILPKFCCQTMPPIVLVI